MSISTTTCKNTQTTLNVFSQKLQIGTVCVCLLAWSPSPMQRKHFMQIYPWIIMYYMTLLYAHNPQFRLRLHVSRYPDVRDSDIFGAFTRVGSKRFRCLHVSRHPDALYAAYSLCVGEIRKCFFLVKLHAFKVSSIFSFLFVDVCWLDDKGKVLFGLFSYRL